MGSKFYFLILILLGISCGKSKTSSEDLPAENSQTPTPTPSPTSLPVPPTTPAPEPIKAALEIVCTNEILLSKFPDELSVICSNGLPSQTIKTALDSPYKGGNEKALTVLNSQDTNKVSNFTLLVVLEIPKPLNTVRASLPTIPTGTLTTSNAVLNRSVIATRGSSSGIDLGGRDVKFDLTVSVGPIEVKSISVLQEDISGLNASLVVIESSLKKDAPENKDDILSNSLTFIYPKDENTTLYLQINRQKRGNLGQHDIASKTAIELGQSLAVDSFTKFNL
jgi:hypothetical protein